MSLIDRYRASNRNTRAIPYTGATQFRRDTSNLNIDRIPSRYSILGRLNSIPDTSNLNIDRIPSRYAP